MVISRNEIKRGRSYCVTTEITCKANIFLNVKVLHGPILVT